MMILRGPLRASHMTRGERQGFKRKAHVLLRDVEKGRERDAEERERRRRGMQGEVVAMDASDSEGWNFCD